MTHFPKHWNCNCMGCRLMRTGVCVDCARALQEQIAQMDEPRPMDIYPCSGACAEAIQIYFAQPREYQPND